MKLHKPVVGDWYKNLQSGDMFEIVAWDPASLVIEAQYVDGEVSSFDLESWKDMLLEPIEEPEDWRNPYEMNTEDALDPDLPYHPEDWSGPLAQIEPEFMNGVEDL